MSYFVFIVTSRDRPEYSVFDSMRRHQLQQLKIPYMFLYNNNNSLDNIDLQDDEWNYRDDRANPGMYYKFKHALRCINLSKYDYILRLNSSTFVDFTRLEEFVIPGLSKQRCLAGNIFDFTCEDDKSITHILSGTAIVMSSDVATWFQNTDNEFEKDVIYDNPDDIAISTICQELGKYRLFELGMFFGWSENDSGDTFSDTTVFYRIKNSDRMKTDIAIWQGLLKKEIVL